jgi:Mg2+ and Co2+ transporter CorA
MKTVSNYGGVTWIDLESPSGVEVREVTQISGLETQTVEELLSPSSKHKVEFGKNHAYIVLHFPSFGESKNGDAAYEVDFILTKKTIVTAHYEQVETLEKFRPTEESENGIFFGLLGELLGNFERKLSSVDHWIREIENKMFAGQEKKTILELSEASRHLIDFRKITAVYPDVFKSLKIEGEKIFGQKFGILSSEISERFEKSKAKLDVLFDTVHELRETNNALLSTKQNESMKTMTMVTIITTIIVGIVLIWIGFMTIK